MTLGLALPFFEGNDSSLQDYLKSSLFSIPFIMIYSLPVIFVYGVSTSIISDKIGEFIANRSQRKSVKFISSGALHILFGLILKWVSLTASILFFVTDRLVEKRRDTYLWIDAIKSLLFPILTLVLCMAIAWIIE